MTGATIVPLLSGVGWPTRRERIAPIREALSDNNLRDDGGARGNAQRESGSALLRARTASRYETVSGPLRYEHHLSSAFVAQILGQVFAHGDPQPIEAARKAYAGTPPGPGSSLDRRA
jgi:hypothetical protein